MRLPRFTQKLRRTIKSAPFRSRGERVPVTISCGVGTFSGEDTLELVFERTDAALYAAKGPGPGSLHTRQQQGRLSPPQAETVP